MQSTDTSQNSPTPDGWKMMVAREIKPKTKRLSKKCPQGDDDNNNDCVRDRTDRHYVNANKVDDNSSVNLSVRSRISQEEISRHTNNSARSWFKLDVSHQELRKHVDLYFKETMANNGSRQWFNKILANMWKGDTAQGPTRSDKRERVHSDESGDALTAAQREQSVPSPAGEDFIPDEIGDVPPPPSPSPPLTSMPPHGPKIDEEEQRQHLQYQVFCQQLKNILKQVSGFPVNDLGLSFDDFRQLLIKYGGDQWMANPNIKLDYKPKIILIRNTNNLTPKGDQETSTVEGESKTVLADNLQTVSAVAEEIYFYPNKIIFQ
ncbi:hypothetical protein BLOT_015934 [Blomia tropicalis]|nr:hypothetical protein BLOT_015934 [Blomia tropicalis]